MELKSIEISNYKSIKSPIKIDLTGGKPTVFTGKNGCGKTNLLETIHIALSERGRYFDGAGDVKIKRTYKLDKTEMQEFFSITEEETADNNLDEIEVFFDRDDPDIKWAKVPAVEQSVEKYKTRLEEVKAEFAVSSKSYLEIIDGFLAEMDYDQFLYFSLDNDGNGNYDGERAFKEHLYQARANFKRTEEEVDKLLNYLAQGAIKFDGYDDNRYFRDYSFNWSFDLPQITAFKFVADKMSAHCLGITEETIKKANAEFERIVNGLNGRLKAEHEKITSQLQKIKEIAEEVERLTRECDDRFYDGQRKLVDRQNSFYNELKTAMRRKCYFLDNENSMLFFDDRNGLYGRSGKRERNLNSYNPIIDAFDNFLKVGNHYKEGESIKEFSKLSGARKTQIVKILNEKFFRHQKPAFDKEIKYKLKMEADSPELFIIEKNGEETSFNNTSLGRRWYLTYVFVKRLLKKGDCLLIDEPAAFLHPQAQTEFRKEIELLAKKGVTVFYSTHSPNMVSFEEDIYCVEMGDGGTEVGKLDFDDKSVKGKLQGIWGSFDFYKDLVFNLSDTTVLFEGEADKACIKKFAELLGYDLSGYTLHVCDGEAILQCFYLLHKSGRKVLMVADNDNKYKSKEHQKQHPNYKSVIEHIETVPKLCYFMGEGKNGRLEDLFEDPERKLPIYNTIEGKKKISPVKIAKIKDLNKYAHAAKNFKKIFEYLDIPKIGKVNG